MEKRKGKETREWLLKRGRRGEETGIEKRR